MLKNTYISHIYILTLTHLVTMGQTGDKKDNCVVLSLWLATELCFL